MKKQSWLSPERFQPQRYEEELSALLDKLKAEPELTDRILHRALAQHPKRGGGFFSKSELIWAARREAARHPDMMDHEGFITKLRAKPIRTQSGVTPLTVLTAPHPCPGRCVFCPNDPRAPKSYLAGEPGAQRAARFHYDAFDQVTARLRALSLMGHPVDKVELIILGGSWTAYPQSYRLAFVVDCFRALNAFDPGAAATLEIEEVAGLSEPDIGPLGRRMSAEEYDRLAGGKISADAPRNFDEEAALRELEALHRFNETALCRSVGLSIETRPDHLSDRVVTELRRLGVTRVQLGCQSLSDRILELNQRGHSVSESQQAILCLRRHGFKVQVHWMANLLGATPESDLRDFARLFSDAKLRPDELKIYPCVLVQNSELVDAYERGDYAPYTPEQLIELLARCLHEVPEYCRVNRVVRDIPGTDLLVGYRLNSLRNRVETAMVGYGLAARDIRSREIRGKQIEAACPTLETLEYEAGASRECFLQFVDSGRLLGFARLGLPTLPAPLEELRGCALLREVHVYGQAVRLGERSAGKVQHSGLGAQLIERAASIARDAGFHDLAVISAVGTRGYYRKLGFVDGQLYQHLALGR